MEGKQTAEEQCQPGQKPAPGYGDDACHHCQIKTKGGIDAITNGGAGQVGNPQQSRYRITGCAGQCRDAKRHLSRCHRPDRQRVVKRDPGKTERGETKRGKQCKRRGGGEIGLDVAPFHMACQLVQDEHGDRDDHQRNGDPDRGMFDDPQQPAPRRRYLSDGHRRFPPAGRSVSAATRPAFPIDGQAGGRFFRATGGSPVRP